jgi:hypothetical protein
MQYALRVGTDAETAHPRYAEFAGLELFGPIDEAAARGLCRETLAEFLRVAQEDPDAFVYGAPVCEVVALRPLPEARVGTIIVEAIARNWYMDEDSRAQQNADD